MNSRLLEDCLQEINGRPILLDTCFFIDSGISILTDKEKEYSDIISRLRADSNYFVTILPVAIEFYKGSNLIEDFEIKKSFLHKIVDSVYPIDPEISKNALRLCQLYRSEGKNVDSTDYLLAATAAKYDHSMVLLTKNSRHFPLTIFDRITLLPIEHENGSVELYSFLKYSKIKANKILDHLATIEAKNSRKF